MTLHVNNSIAIRQDKVNIREYLTNYCVVDEESEVTTN